jgi:orotate phosphoribosyltransferase
MEGKWNFMSKNLSLEERVAKALFDVKAVKINVNEPFTFASGIKSPIYCDNRFVLGFSNERDVIVDGFVQAIDNDVDVIVGVATAGIPWASFIADRMKKPLAYVRNKPKDHGAGKQIEGAEVKGKKVVVIEDLITTGKSSLIAVEVLQKEGVADMEVKSIFTYGFDTAKENYDKFNCKFSSLSNFSILINLLKNTDYLTKEEAEIALEWSKSPNTWGVK